jgi:hypothetical protein
LFSCRKRNPLFNMDRFLCLNSNVSDAYLQWALPWNRHHGFNVKLKSTDISHRRLIPHRSLQSRVACVTKCLFYLHYTRIYTFFFVNKPVFLCTVLPQMNCVLKVIFNRDFNCNLYYHREWMIYEVIWDKAV